MMEEYARIQDLTARLNRYRDEYYNQNAPSVSDEVYDRLFDELAALEKQTGVQMANSPTRTVGYPAVSGLEKTVHTIPLLSLDKTKDSAALLDFIGEQQIMLMLKLDGLTLKLTYENGQLTQAATRGDGSEGEVVTHNTRGISGIPQAIPYKERLVVTGEAFIRPSDFEDLCDAVTDANGVAYKNSRNLAAGSVRLLNAADCAARRVTFMPFGVIEGFADLTLKSKKLARLAGQGFTPCKCFVTTRRLSQKELEDGIARLRGYARENDIPIDGCAVSRASLHNLNFINDLRLKPGCRVLVSKRNQIIPHVEDNLDKDADFQLADAIPRACPCCGQATRVHVARKNGTCGTMTLHCDNEQCGMRRVRQFAHFAGKKAMDIEGLSEAVLEKFMGRGWLHSYMDVYRLDAHAAEIMRMEGFGEKSWQKLWDAIQHSRDTTFERYLVAMDIPLMGRTAGGVLAKQFGSDLAAFEEAALTGYDFTRLPDFGEALNGSIHTWFEDEENLYVWEELQTMVNIQKPKPGGSAPAVQNNPFAGKNIVVTGKVEPYTRAEMNALIESLGAHAQSAVSGKTDYLVCGESAGSKLTKARQLGVAVLRPSMFFSMAQDVRGETA